MLPDTDLPGDATQVEVEGGTLPLWVAGSGPVLLLIHGWMLDARIWRPQIAALSSRFRVACFDRRGSGQATAMPDPAKEVADIGALIDAIGADRVALVAMSQGARSALAFSAQASHRVSGLVLAGAPLPYQPSKDVASENLPVAAMRSLALANDLKALREMAIANELASLPGATAGADRLLAKIVGDYCGRDLLANSAPLQISPSTLAQIANPALLIVGEHDTAMRRHAAAALAELMMDAQLLSIGGAGHICSLSHPARFNASLEKFLSRV